MYQNKTPEAIKTEILGALTTDLDKREGSFADDMAGPLALELYKLYSSLEAVQSVIWVDETSGPYLDMAAEDMGLPPRKQGTRARVELLLTGSPGYTLPAGSTFLTGEGLTFSTLEDVTLDEGGSGLAEAQAKEAGARYNVEADTVTGQYVNNPRIEGVTNPQPGLGGTDPETDAALYARIVFARQKPSTSGNIYDYQRWALETPGVGAVKVYPLQNGPGTVTVLIAGPDRQPVDELVTAACAAHIEEVRPIGASVTVRSATSRPIDVSARVVLAAGSTFEQVRERFTQALSSYLEEVAFVESRVLYSRVGALLIGTQGVADYRDLLVCGGEESIELTEEEIPAVGEVALTWS